MDCVTFMIDKSIGIENGNNRIGIIISLFLDLSVMPHITFPMRDKKEFVHKLNIKIMNKLSN